MKKIIGVLCMLMLVNILPAVVGLVANQNYTINTTYNEDTDEWSMFRHDLQRSGYSTSEAPDSNNVLWSYPTGGVVGSSPAVVNGKVYIGSGDDNIYCLDASTGEFIWSYTTGVPIHSSPAVVDGKVYIGSGREYEWGKVYCLDAETGGFIWSYPTGAVVSSSPAVVNGKVYIGSGRLSEYWGKVYCLDADTGGHIWSFTPGSYVHSSPAIYDGRVYIGTYNIFKGDPGKVYCLDAETGEIIWSYMTGDHIYSSPTIANGKVYVGSFDDKVYCLDAEGNGDGTTDLIWKYKHPLGGFVFSSPAVVNGKVYVGSQYNGLSGRVFCLDAEGNGDGTTDEIWDYITVGIVVSSPAIADGKIYIGSYGPNQNEPPYNGYIYCLNADNGEKLWNFAIESPQISSPAIAYGKMYIGSDDGKLYCFGPNKADDIPETPVKPIGRTSVYPRLRPRFYITYTDDPDDDWIYYQWDWTESRGFWYIFPRLEITTRGHSWLTPGVYQVTVRAADDKTDPNRYSDWSEPLTVTVKDWPGTCFLAGTRVTMVDDSYKNIEDIRVGDLVKAYDLTFEEFVEAEVIRVYQHEPEEMTDHYLIINDELSVTPNHLFYIDGDLISAGELQEGSLLTSAISDSALEAEVASIDKVFTQVTTYNFEITPLGENYGVTTGYGYIVEDLIAYPYKINNQQSQSQQQSISSTQQSQSFPSSSPTYN